MLLDWPIINIDIWLIKNISFVYLDIKKEVIGKGYYYRLFRYKILQISKLLIGGSNIYIF